MKNTPQCNLSFEKISGCEEQINNLYIMLKSRKHNISHKHLPNYEDHKKFVLTQPYRAWYLIKENSNPIGTIYITKENCLSVFLLPKKYKYLQISLEFIMKKHNPLKEKKSIRPPYFYINIAPDNKKLIYLLHQLGWDKIQITFAQR